MSVAGKWFVPDTEFLAAKEDYAVVGEPAAYIRRLLREESSYPENDPDHEGESLSASVTNKEREWTIQDELNGFDYGDVFGIGAGRQLLYADVDRDDPEHRNISQRIANEGSLKEKSEKNEEAKKKVIDYLVGLHDPVDREESESVEEWTRKNRAYVVKLISKSYGIISHKLVNYLLSIDNEADRRETLVGLSGQALRKTQRPVLLYIGMIDDCTSEELGNRRGWAIAYDFYIDHLIIKPFLADETHHPLAEKWNIELPEDGISFSGRPSTFVGRLLKLHADVEGKEYQKDPRTFGHKILVYYHVLEWLIEHWKPLASIKQVEGESPMTDHDLTKLKFLLDFIEEESAHIPCPYKLQKPPAGKPGTIREFAHMQTTLEDYEEIIRGEVIKAKEAGRETAAQNAAKLYGQMLEQLRSFNLEPEKEI
ncbi:MAG: hypothetical protein Q9201_005458 [Fulgogasparrea decipioides]